MYFWVEDNYWNARKDSLAELIKKYDIDIIGTQELCKEQLEYLMGKLPGWDYSQYMPLRPKDMGNGKRGFNNAIIYKKEKYQVLDEGTFFIQKDVRFCVWTKFKDKKTGKNFYFFNTHYPVNGDDLKKECSSKIIKEVKNQDENASVFLVGDFNSKNKEPCIAEILNSKIFADSKAISKTPPQGPPYSYREKDYGPNHEMLWRKQDYSITENKHIDYIFVSPNISVKSFICIDDTFNAIPPSDHRPILIEAELD